MSSAMLTLSQEETPMRKTYQVLASLIAVMVVVQAMMIVWAITGLFAWINEDGGSLDKSVMDSWENDPPTFEGAIGHFFHAFIFGTALIPLLGLILLIVSFFAKVPRGVPLAALVLLVIVVQYLLGTFAASGVPVLGMLHGLNAFILFGSAVFAARTARTAGAVEAAAPAV
jgi:hypothetical protein